MSAGSSPSGEAGGRLPLVFYFYVAKVRNPTNRCPKSVKECKRVQQNAKECKIRFAKSLIVSAK
jgi:hypothetical protein